MAVIGAGMSGILAGIRLQAAGIPLEIIERHEKEARFDERTGRWRLTLERRDGTREALEANAVISAVGQLNRPKWPDVPGRARFEGISFHSTEWQHEHDLTGKRILVIGTGASAFQFAPEIARVAGDVTIFQRTPPWMAPVPTYHDNVPA